MSYTLPTLFDTALPFVIITGMYWQLVASIYRKIYGIFYNACVSSLYYKKGLSKFRKKNPLLQLKNCAQKFAPTRFAFMMNFIINEAIRSRVKFLQNVVC